MVTEKDLEGLIDKVDEVVDKQYDFIKEMKNIKQTIWQMRAEVGTAAAIAAEVPIVEEKAPIIEEKAPIIEEIVPPVMEEEAVTSLNLPPTPSERGSSDLKEEAIAPAIVEEEEVVTPPIVEEEETIVPAIVEEEEAVATPAVPFTTDTPKNWDWERFIGENLFSKIGIGIVLIGVFIGVKYSIDHNLISPAMRLVLGYMVGVGLFVTGAVLKRNYKNFSAILVSGAMAIFYFVTFIAYSVFGFFPQGLTFGLMFVFTAFTVLASLSYNQVAIALIGLVGSYAIPFLLSNNSGRVDVLFAYTAIINIGVLVLSFYKRWMLLFVSAFFFTWILLLAMFVDTDTVYRQGHFVPYMVFNTVTFLTFYGSFIAQKVRQVLPLAGTDVGVFLGNSLLFYGIGAALVNSVYPTDSVLAVFTLANALFHLGVAYYFHTRKEDYNSLKYLVLVLALSFATLVIPIQFKGSWITLFWSAEAALLFSFGRLKGLAVFERIGYAVTALATGSMLMDWVQGAYSLYSIELATFHIAPFANALFVNALLYCAAMGIMLVVHQRKPLQNSYNDTISFFLNVLAVGGLYYTFFHEIGVALDMRALQQPDIIEDYTLMTDLELFKYSAYIIYTLAFVSVYSMLNVKWLKNKNLAEVQLTLGFVLAGVFIIFGLYNFSELRDRYISEAMAGSGLSVWFLNVRYLGIAGFALLCYAIYHLQQYLGFSARKKRYSELLLHLAIVWVGSSELLHWTQLYESTSNYKLGLTILWGAYSVLLIVLGLVQNKKYLRVWSITLIGFCILKLFVYDTTHLDALRKTIVFVVLGLLILVASFLYYKYNKKEEGKENVDTNE